MRRGKREGGPVAEGTDLLNFAGWPDGMGCSCGGNGPQIAADPFAWLLLMSNAPQSSNTFGDAAK